MYFMETEKSMRLFTTLAASVNQNVINVCIDWSIVWMWVYTIAMCGFVNECPISCVQGHYACLHFIWMATSPVVFSCTTVCACRCFHVSPWMCANGLVVCVLASLCACVFSGLQHCDFYIDNLLVPVIQRTWVERPFSFSLIKCPWRHNDL